MKIVDVVEQAPVSRSHAATASRMNALALAAVALQVALSAMCACVIVQPADEQAAPVQTAAFSPP